jgi:tRNA (guanine37-N1)-methyltransferase
MMPEVKHLRVDVITLFEPMFDALRNQGVTARAFERQLVDWHIWNPRDYVQTQYKSVDDRPYGGGPGMVMMAAPLASAIDAAIVAGAQQPVIFLSPQGSPLTQTKVNQLAQSPGFTLLCGRYEGIDERLLQSRVTEEISIGDFVVSGGELPAMMLLDAVLRQLPGVLNDERSAQMDSFSAGLLDHPHYTRPEVFEDRVIPTVLQSGHHVQIEQWRRQQALLATANKRPEVWRKAIQDQRVSAAEIAFVKHHEKKS